MAQAIARRSFLAAAAAAAALAGVGRRLWGEAPSALVKGARAKSAARDEWVNTTCRMCRWHDGIRVHVVDGVVVKIEGQPDNPQTFGRICGKANAGIMALYNPWRVKVPMKRTNPEKGLGVDPKWVEISWEEALDTVASRLKPVLDEDPRQFMFATTFGTLVRGVIGSAFGTPNEVGWGPGEFCGGGYHLPPMRIFNNTSNAVDLDFCKYLINVGVLFMFNGKGIPEHTRGVLDARENGLKMVVLDPLQTPEAAKADEWIPIRPATDQAFALAMSHVLVHELGLYDTWSIKYRTNGPYLVGPDGWYVRSTTETYVDPVRKETLGKPLVWDPVDKVARTFDDPAVKDFAIEGTYVVNGVTCQPAFQKLKDFLRPYTPEWAEKITTVPAATIRRIAKEFGEAAQIGKTIEIDGVKMPYRPVAVVFCKGSQGHYHASLICRALALPNVLVGAFNVPGGARGDEGTNAMPKPGPDGTVLPTGFTAYRFTYPPQRIDQFDMHPLAHSGGSHIAYSILHPERYGYQYRIKVLGINFTNPFKNMYNAKIVEEAFKKIPFIFSIAYHFDEPTEMADIVLPEPSYLERWEYTPRRTARFAFKKWQRFAGSSLSTVRRPVVERLYNTRDSMEIMGEIAARVGRLSKWNEALNRVLRLKEKYRLEPDKKYPWAEVIDRQMRSMWGDDVGVEWFKEHGFRGRPASHKEYYGYYHYPQSRTALIYDEYIKWCGERYRKDCEAAGIKLPDYVYQEFDPLPTWRGMGPLEKAPAQYDLYAVNYGLSLGSMCMAMDNPWIAEYMALFDPYSMYLWINSDTAKAKGLKDGDVAWVESQFGHRIKATVKTSQCVHPDVVGIGGCFGNRSVNVAPSAREGPLFNTLVGSSEDTLDPLGGNIEGSPRVRIYKA